MRDLFFRFCRKTKSLKGLTTIILLCSVASSMAQSKISGTVTDDKGLTLPAVTVAVKGGNNSVVTDMDGKYQIVANSDATLVFSFIGFATKEVQVNGKNTIDVKLSENVEGLKEVVVIGYGSQKKERC